MIKCSKLDWNILNVNKTEFVYQNIIQILGLILNIKLHYFRKFEDLKHLQSYKSLSKHIEACTIWNVKIVLFVIGSQPIT